ncbi:unnamed protein product [Rotaria magnacalcarata]|uniref:Uncharacterized protein n=1 Tax=Rotaria magnacalcarata TaxID=392030 RepID=A0A819UW37_9BILA|nr:unnamed protein product [Rotaria magnacalcarata]
MGSSSNRSLLCEAFDGFSESSITTGMYEFSIKDSRLSLLGACTGGSLHLLLARYTVHKISDGCDNRFLYHFIENNPTPYDLVKKSDRLLPSLQQIFVVVHLIGRVVYKFIDSLGNDEAQRYYATKGRYYIEEGQRLFRERQQPHLQSFYSKSAEIFPRLCMKKHGDLEFSQMADRSFVNTAKRYVERSLSLLKQSDGVVISTVTLETCQITANLYDNYLFKTTMGLLNLERSSTQLSMPSNNFRNLLAEKPSVEKRLLQLPFQFFLRSDLKQPTINESGRKTNAPFHHIDSNELNNILNKLVEQQLLSIGNFISRPKAQPTFSYMKNPIPNDPYQQELFLRHLEHYKMNVNEYNNLLARSNLPNKCILLPDAKTLLTSSAQHCDNCVKYGLVSAVNLSDDDDVNRGTIASNFENLDNPSGRSLFVDMPVLVTTIGESNERDDLIEIRENEDVLLNKNDNVIASDLSSLEAFETNAGCNNEHSSNSILHNHQGFDHNRETTDDQPLGPNDDIEPRTDEATFSSVQTKDVRTCVTAILQYPSIILSSSDIALATRDYSSTIRQRVVHLMIEKNLLREDDYLVRKLAKKLKMVKGFAKQVPSLNDEQSRFNFITTLNEFGITWESFNSFFDPTKDGFSTATQLRLSEIAEALLESEDYKAYVTYDKRVVFRAVENTPAEYDDLQCGENVTGIEPFETAGKYSVKRKKSGVASRSKRKKN